MPRSGLNAQVIVDGASELADAHGIDRLTLALLAKHFGVAAPSLYKHIDGLEHVQQLLAVKSAREVGDLLRRAVSGRSAEAALRALASAYRGFAIGHPGIYASIQSVRTDGDADFIAASDDVLTTLYAVLSGYDITGDRAVDAARFLRSSLHGFATLEIAGGFGMPHSVDRSFDELVAAVHRALVSWPAAAG